MSEKRSALPAVCSLKVSSTTNPSSAISMAGLSTSSSDMDPYRRNAVSQVSGVPGTPMPSPLFTRSKKGSGSPVSGSMNNSEVTACGAVSRPSMVMMRCASAR